MSVVSEWRVLPWHSGGWPRSREDFIKLRVLPVAHEGPVAPSLWSEQSLGPGSPAKERDEQGTGSFQAEHIIAVLDRATCLPFVFSANFVVNLQDRSSQSQ